MGMRRQGTSSPEKDFCILKADGLNGNWGKSRGSGRVQAKGGRLGWKVGSQRVPKVLIVGASFHPRGRQVPGMREGLVGQAPAIVDVCGVRVHQHASYPVLGGIDGLEEEEAEARLRPRGKEDACPTSLPVEVQDSSVFPLAG